LSPLWRRKGVARRRDSAATFGALFVHFRRVVTTNNQILEKIADLERVLGGEYIYDRAFLQSAVFEIVEQCRHVIYHLNAMSDDRYAPLFERFITITNHLSDILAGGLGPYGAMLVLDWEVLHRDLGHLAGNKGASLGEASNSLRLPVPAGFVVSTTGYRRFMEANDLYERITRVLEKGNDTDLQANQIMILFAGAKMPADLAGAIKQALRKIRTRFPAVERFAVRSSGVDEDGERSFAGQFTSLLDIPMSGVAAACIKVMASRFTEGVCRYMEPGTPVEAAPMAVVVQPMIDAQSSGVLYTRDPNNPTAETMVLSAVPGLSEDLALGRDSGDRFVFDRAHPFGLRMSTIGLRIARGGELDPLARIPNGLRRGSGVVELNLIRRMAEYGLLLEKRFEYSQDIEWCVDGSGQIWILQSRPLRLRQEKGDRLTLNQLSEKLAGLPVLMTGRGHICQLGLAGGRVVHVNEATRVENFPVGAVAVSHFADPVLAEIVRRASAIITDVGSPTSHLATIARECRTPALFGTEKGTALLPEGVEVMVDIETQTVYQGRMELPAELPWNEEFEPLPGSMEDSLLRSLLRLIAPLNLTDPDSPAFRMENCRTIHDFLRFCHEKAVAELIGFRLPIKLISGDQAPLLATGLPINLRILDIGGGLKRRGGNQVTAQNINCMPFIFFLKGFLNRDFWSEVPPSMGLRDVIAGVIRSLGRLGQAPYRKGENLAIIAEHYCNLNLRLGYHFNIIDCYLSEEADDNYVYFRFAGGFAEPGKRERRVMMISQILTGLHFKVEQKGDLLQGKVKMLEGRDMEAILVRLGELAAFTRHLDIKMVDDQAVTDFFNEFLRRIDQKPPLAGE